LNTALSHWFIYHKKRSSQSVQLWKQEIDIAEPERKLLLLYLANDILQESRKRGNEFINEFMAVIGDAVIMTYRTNPEPIRTKLMRLLDIWVQRTVFSGAFVNGIIQSINSNQYDNFETYTPNVISSPLKPEEDISVEYSESSENEQPQKEKDKKENDLHPDSIQNNFQIYNNSNLEILNEHVIKIIQQLSESLKQYPVLMDAEESAKEIAPDCILNSYKTQLELNESSLNEYKSQLDQDYSLTLTIDQLLSTFLSHFQNHLKSQEETIEVLNQLLSSTKKLHLKLDQRIGQSTDIIEVDTPSGSKRRKF